MSTIPEKIFAVKVDVPKEKTKEFLSHILQKTGQMKGKDPITYLGTVTINDQSVQYTIKVNDTEKHIKKVDASAAVPDGLSIDKVKSSICKVIQESEILALREPKEVFFKTMLLKSSFELDGDYRILDFRVAPPSDEAPRAPQGEVTHYNIINAYVKGHDQIDSERRWIARVIEISALLTLFCRKSFYYERYSEFAWVIEPETRKHSYRQLLYNDPGVPKEMPKVFIPRQGHFMDSQEYHAKIYFKGTGQLPNNIPYLFHKYEQLNGEQKKKYLTAALFYQQAQRLKRDFPSGSFVNLVCAVECMTKIEGKRKGGARASFERFIRENIHGKIDDLDNLIKELYDLRCAHIHGDEMLFSELAPTFFSIDPDEEERNDKWRKLEILVSLSIMTWLHTRK